MTQVQSVIVHSTLTKVHSFEKQDIRCYNCNKLLAKSNVKGFVGIEIKCPRCRVINEV
jgi:hypothetical protein